MASNKIKGLTIKLGADYQGLDTALKSVESGSRKAASEIKEIDRALKTAGDSSELWTQKQKLLTTALEESQKKLKLLEDAQEDVNKQFSEKRIDEEQYRAFKREVEYAKAAVDKYASELSKADEKVREFGGDSKDTAKDVDDLGDKTEDAGKQADSAAKGGFTVLKGALADLAADGIRKAAGELKDFTGDIIRTGMDYEASMSSVAAISGATSAEMDKLSAKAEEMGATTKFTATESADAFGYMALAGWKVEDMLSGIDGVLNLAAASNMDLANASDIVTDYLTAFGLSAKDSGHFVDIMTYAMANSNTTAELLGEAYKSCAATAASMGYSVEETTAVLMTMANAGIKGGEAGTALNAVMTRLATDTKGCASELSKYGVQVYDSKGEMQSLTSILEGTSAVWEQLTDQEQANLAKTLAGTSHYSALQTIMNGLSDSAKASGMSFGDYSKALEDCDGAASDMSHTMMDNLQGDMTLLSSAVDGMKLSLSKELNPEIRKGVQYLTKNIPAIERILSKFFNGVISAVKTVAKWIPDIISAVQRFKPVIIGTLSAIAAYKVLDKISKGIELVGKLNTTMSLSPLGAVAIGVGALATAFTLLNSSQKDSVTIADQVAEKYKKEQAAVNDLRSSMGNLSDSFYSSAAQADAETKRVEDLWKELDKLTDSTGRVSDADKKRAEYILGELNEALGTEYTMTGNQIDQYKEMESEIDTLIAKKRAAAYLDAYSAQSAEYAKNQAEALASYQTAYANYNRADAQMVTSAEKITKNLASNGIYIDPSEMRNGIPAEYRKLIEENKKYDGILTKNLLEYDAAWEERQKNNTLMRQSKEVYDKSLDYRTRLDNAEKAYSAGDYKSVESILYDPVDADKYTLKYESDIEKREEAFNNLLDKSQGSFKLAIDSNSQYAVDEALEALAETFDAGSLTGQELGEVFAQKFGSQVQEMVDKGFDISKLSAWAKSSGIKVGDVFKGDFGKVIQSQIDKGYDTTALMEWARNSGMKMTDVFGETVDFKKVITDQIEGGYDIRGLLVWAEESGFKVGNEYDKEFMKQVQAALDNFDPKTAKLVEWAEKQGISLGEIFGENFKNSSAYNRFLYDTNNLVIMGINSAGDYQRWKNGEISFDSIGKPVAKNAAGGYIGAGKKAVVAEAGPELLEVMNGGIKVTPLSRDASNRYAGDTGSVTNYYQTFNVTANISNDYDVRKLSEKLSVLSRSNSFGKGLA
ncbi:MAG: phage tail tape measure protein [Ruminococcus sp.]|nr:phage tail tape measure protein [Ruminococcus sp.]